MASHTNSVPFTPRPSSSASNRSTHSRFRATGATLSTREENKISHTLASIRKPARPSTLSNQLEHADIPQQPFLRPSSSSSSVAPGSTVRNGLMAPPPVPSATSRPRSERQSTGSSSGSSRRPLTSLSSIERTVDRKPDETGRKESRRDDIKRSARDGKEREHVSPLSTAPSPPAEYMPEPSPSPPADTFLEKSSLLGKSEPLDIQEAIVMCDLISVLKGIEGHLVSYDPGYDPLDEGERIRGPGWVIDGNLDQSFASVLREILPIASYYMGVKAFVESRCSASCGKVNHALGRGIQELLLEYLLLLTQLQDLLDTTPSLNLRTMYYHLRPTIHSLSILHSLANTLFLADDDDDDDEEDEEVDDDDDDDGVLGVRIKDIQGLVGEGPKMGRGGGGLVMGGEVLELIWEIHWQSGDPIAQDIYSNLFLHASQPYAEMLVDWISTGHLSDKSEEFMVKEATSITKEQLDLDFTDEYWERRYTLRDGSTASNIFRGGQPPSTAGIPLPRRGTESTSNPRLPGGACIPKFLEPWKHKILLAGKYLNVIRECGASERQGRPSEFRAGGGRMIDMRDELFQRRIEDAYFYANQTLLKMLIEEQDLKSHLRSLKYHFFLSQSAWMTHFLDLSLSEFGKSSKNASLVKLQSLLELTLRTSGGQVGETHKDNVRVVMAGQKLHDFLNAVVNQSAELSGENGRVRMNSEIVGSVAPSGGRKQEEKKRELLAFEAFQLDYTVKFPLSLAISRKTIARYQILFRFLLQLRHAELQLSLMWTEHTTDDWRRRTKLTSFEAWKRRVFALRARMLGFVQNLSAFLSHEVLEPNWRNLEEKLSKVTTVDQMLNDHVDFLDTCLKESGLTKAELIAVIAKIIALIQNFCHHAKVLSSYARNAMDAIDRASSSEILINDEKSQERSDLLEKYERNFSHQISVHIDRMTYHAGSDNTALDPLVARLKGNLRPKTSLSN
ncbi:Gamma-tubulin complex, DGRIP84/SPC97 component [Phaffia rhodozyma]|uniref:Spindle pole body component n=1 Tax=Phaffia rhodozyma TaxID=264483 RepID=A0A0F7SEJ7_PHARH|nr:Gamma-tubulin complex, DGRIP84/SPC97 component [Phaffia rhodozyma]